MPRAFVTAGLPALAAGFRVKPEDFEVEEIPAYEPSGTGTHTFLWIEKRGIPTDEAVRRIARRLGCRPREVGYAGRKDARALTRQTLSLEHVGQVDPAAIEDDHLRLLRQGLHGNKLRTGHLRGNRFRIRLRDVAPDAEPAARAALARLEAIGVPNRFGGQRFGSVRQSTAALGLLLLHGDAVGFGEMLVGRPAPAESPQLREARACYDAGDLPRALELFPGRFNAERAYLQARLRRQSPERAVRAVPKRTRRLYVSAAQSLVFNELLDARIAAGRLARVEAGDVARLEGSGGSFIVEDPEREQPRADVGEISPAGPLFGSKLLEAAGDTARREGDAFARHRVRREDLGGSLVSPPDGARRAYRMPLRDLTVARDGDDLVLGFVLRPGGYATAVISELFQDDVG